MRIKASDLGRELSPEEIQELDAAASRPIVYDEDSPQMTPEMLAEFKRVRQISRNKQTASIRLSEKAQKFSRAYGKGYTSFFSRLIDAALDDEALVKKCI